MIVERKNRVVKDALERIDNDPQFHELNMTTRMHAAVFSSNIVYGNRVASSFELVRGYTPSISGSGKMVLPKSIRDGHDEMQARRLLARILKSKASRQCYSEPQNQCR